MDKYRRIPNKSDADELGPDEVRITARGRVTKYVEYALKLLKEGTEQSDGPLDTIVIKAAGRAINKAVLTVEIVKRRVKGLHQENELKTLEMNDRWEPLEQGLHEVITTRRLPYIIVTLTTSVGRVNTGSPGYQEPLPEEIVDADTQAKQEANTRRSERRRSGQQDFNNREDRGDRRGPGGRGRGGRGQGRRRGGGGGGQGGGGGNQQGGGGRRRRRQGGGNQQGGGGHYDRGQSQAQQQGGRRRRRYDDDMDFEDDGRGQYNQGFQGRQRRDRQDGRRRRGRGGYRGGGGGQGGNYQGGRRGGNGGGGNQNYGGGYNEDYVDQQGGYGGGGQRRGGGYSQRRQRGGPRYQSGGGGGPQYGYSGQY